MRRLKTSAVALFGVGDSVLRQDYSVQIRARVTAGLALTVCAQVKANVKYLYPESVTLKSSAFKYNYQLYKSFGKFIGSFFIHARLM